MSSAAIEAGGSLLVYTLLLWRIALWGEGVTSRRGVVSPDSWWACSVYALTFAIYHTAWAYFGTAGAALRHGVTYMGIYIGPAVLVIFGHSLLNKIISVTKRQKATSVADFIACRYGKAQLVALAVTLVLLPTMLLYIAIQLNATGVAFTYLSHCLDQQHEASCKLIDRFRRGPEITNEEVLWSAAIAFAMAVFSGLFGVRRINSSARHGGLMLAMAFESFVKVATLSIVTLVIGIAKISNKIEAANLSASARSAAADPLVLFSISLISFFAFICLPHMYHVIAVEHPSTAERQNTKTAQSAGWIYLAYLGILGFCVFVISEVDISNLQTPSAVHVSQPDQARVLDAQPPSGDGSGQTAPLDDGKYSAGDFRLLELVHALPWRWPFLVTIIGAFAAASGMMIVSSVSMATMICNVIAMPIVGWSKSQIGQRRAPRSSAEAAPAHGLANEKLLLKIRWSSVGLIYLLAFVASWYIRHIRMPIASIGLLSFSFAAQLGPALIFGLYWRSAHRFGAIAGIAAGFAVLLLMWPTSTSDTYNWIYNWIASAGLASLMVNALVFGIVSLAASGIAQSRKMDAEDERAGSAILPDLDQIQAEAVVSGELSCSYEPGFEPCSKIKVRHVSAFLDDFSVDALRRFENFLRTQREFDGDRRGDRAANSDVLNELHDRVAELRGPIRALPYISANLSFYLDKGTGKLPSPETVRRILISALNSRLAPASKPTGGEITVFIIHGHDEEARRQVAGYVKQLGLPAVLMQEEANNGREVLEKFEQCSGVGYAIAILTPDDEAAAQGGQPKGRARQNVVLEIGYFLAKLGRRKVLLITRGEIELPSDLGGMGPLAINFDKDNWRQKLLNELLAAGIVFRKDEGEEGR
jgi:Na+/proline symporter